ncbi:MAG: alanine--tRNA ligase [Cyclobacteriaceae bacterium]
MTSAEIRKNFLQFFESKGHLIVPSAPLVLKNDPTLLFTNSGMVQFKDFFLGNARPKSLRIVDTQKCLRVSGKHNDLEDVGMDTYHQTMFEMLGNWSFGDYFKKEAIAWAWELLTTVYKLPPERLYATVFGGDAAEGLDVDQEAMDLWIPFIGKDRVLHGSKKDNFWEMGDAGPCGPCSEIHIDLRSEKDRALVPGKDLVNKDHPQVVEIWNLVFMQFNRLASGQLEPLPDKHVDTGMGFERLCMAIQGKTSNYDTDVFTPLIDFISAKCGIAYGAAPKTDIAIRVVADHIRAVSFAIADGQLPSNTGAGYVIRRILRRAVRYSFSWLEMKEPFLYTITPVLAGQFKDVFPELHQQLDYVSKVVLEEENSFLRTLDKGLKRMEGLESISGAQAFELYDTYGFPLDLTALIARERGWTVDEQDFRREMEKQKSRSRADAVKETGDWNILSEKSGTEFIGYDYTTSESRVIKYRRIKQKNRELYQVVLDKTPFYAESGGQSGDTGFLLANGEKLDVLDTVKENDLIIHITENFFSDPEGIVLTEVNTARRRSIMNNHSATHLLHAALRQILGKHVEQRGSLVDDRMLRFDFSHFAALTGAELLQIEDLVNQKIRENISTSELRQVPIAQAKEMGAMALFGEKYGDLVRVITFDPSFSVELCGGTHVPATGTIGYFRIVSEGSVAAGVRRIEAVTASGAQHYAREESETLDAIRELFKNPKDPLATINHLIEEKAALEKKLEQLYQRQAIEIKEKLASNANSENGRTLIIESLILPDADSMKTIAYALRQQFADLLLILAANVEGKPMVTVMIGEELLKSGRYHAGNMVRELAKEISGGGGGQPFYATAGGKNADGIPNLINKAVQLVG